MPFQILGAVAAALAVVASVAQSVQNGTDRAWLQAIGLTVFAASSVLYLFAPPMRPVATALLFGVMGVALVGVYWAQPVGVPVGMFLLAALATMRPPLRLMLSLAAGVAVLFCAVQLPSGHESPATAAAVVAGMLFFAGVGVLLLSERRQRERVAALLAELETARAAEQAASLLTARTAAAREVHDVLAHSLSGLIIQLEAARLQARASHADAALEASVDNALRAARAGLAEARRAVAALRGDRPQGADDIPGLIEEHRLTTGSPLAFEIIGEPRGLPDDSGLALYRAAQETLSNIRKHAAGAAAEVRLAWEPERVVLAVTNPAAAASAGSPGWGLEGIRERVEELHGTMDAGLTNGAYTVTVQIPLGNR